MYIIVLKSRYGGCIGLDENDLYNDIVRGGKISNRVSKARESCLETSHAQP